MTEISDKLWLAVDYMGGNNVMGAFSFGAAWAFSKNVSVIAGYDIYNQRSLAGANTLTFQVDINFLYLNDWYMSRVGLDPVSKRRITRSHMRGGSHEAHRGNHQAIQTG